MMNLEPQKLKFGDLLLKLKLITDADLKDALQVAPQFGLPIGKTLVLSGHLSEDELLLAVELQPLVNRKGYSLEAARQAAVLVRKEKVSAQEALRRLGMEGGVDKATLGSILLEAGAISQQQLDDARRRSYETGMRLGRMLVLNGAITDELVTFALDIQSKVRDGRMTLKQGIELLRLRLPQGKTAPPWLENRADSLSPPKKQVRLGEFLVISGLATEAEILNAMETSLNKQWSLGQAILELGLISKRVFDKAVQLHEQVCAGEVALTQAAGEINQMVFGNPDDKGGRTGLTPVLGELLKMTGFVSDADIKEAIELSNKYPSVIGKMLVVSGAIDEATLIASLRCQYLLKHHYLGIDDGIRALRYTKENKVSFDDALEELGMRKPPSV